MNNRITRIVTGIAVAFAMLAGLAPASPAASAPSVVSGESGVVAVKVPANQKNAYPLYGLKAAAMVYVEPVERGFTRHIALYGTDKVPAKVGPVRSIRETDFNVLDAFGKVRIYASGHTESRKIMDDFLASTKHVLRTSDDGAEEIYTVKKCVEPFCHFLKGTSVPGRNSGLSMSNANIRKHAGLVAGAIPAKVLGTGSGVRWLKIEYKKTPYATMIPRTIAWDAKKKLWIYSASGRNATLDVVNGKTVSGQTSSPTAIIQFSSAKNAGSAFACRTMSQGGPDAVPYTNSVGKGSGLLMRGGKIFKITWSRASSTSPTSNKFLNGSSVKTLGQVWVFLVPINLSKTTIRYANGNLSVFVPKSPAPRWSFSTSVLKERKACEAPVKISVTKNKTKKTTIIKVGTKFDSLSTVSLKGAKVTVKVTGKGYLKRTTSLKTGQIIITGDPSKVVSVSFDGQVINLQHYASAKWGN